ncbi:hypothetical protein KWU85_02605 [Clostridioides difficile]|nr:hypothetical protein [Clostridioides difficile]EKG0757330.1 hypothetical protein [Clostridioides difficile]EKG0784612.1 hypothetical protein [Clostridioides difficile]EKS6761437.1 hypothetical protein [Clostridioides difficile]MBY2591277.1 hypothetical protein [Clostridioides difficile]
MVMVFNLEKFKVGNAIRISCERFGFEIDCIVVVATKEELNLAYYSKDKGCIEYQALIPEDIRYGDYILERLA